VADCLRPRQHSRWQRLLDFAPHHQCDWPKNPAQQPHDGSAGWGIHLDDDPPHNRLLGPVFERGPVTGVILQHGRELFAFGTPERADMTFSVTKTYLALLAGIAWDDGLINDLHEPIAAAVTGIGFNDSHNSAISWHHMLQFTSEWQGSCWGVPDQIDRYRTVGLQKSAAIGRKGDARDLQPPGSYWEYNDVRINQFALALMHRFGCSLPQVFKERISDPMGLDSRHHWYGYHNSWIELNGQYLQSVPGGGHWGGGMRICARDQAAIGQMMLDRGVYCGQRIVSADWIDRMLEPCDIACFYGYFTWLNRLNSDGERAVAAASEQSFFALGVGGQLIWHEPRLSAVVVLRWINPAFTDQWIELIATLIGESDDS